MDMMVLRINLRVSLFTRLKLHFQKYKEELFKLAHGSLRVCQLFSSSVRVKLALISQTMNLSYLIQSWERVCFH